MFLHIFKKLEKRKGFFLLIRTCVYVTYVYMYNIYFEIKNDYHNT